MALSKRKIKRRSNDTYNYILLVLELGRKVRKLRRDAEKLKLGMNGMVGSFARPVPAIPADQYPAALEERLAIKQKMRRLARIHKAPYRNRDRLDNLASQHYRG